jgi:hypothetical protein
MASRLTRKPYYGLAELCERWSATETDIAYYVLERELTLSVAVARLRVETSEEDQDVNGHPSLASTGHRWVVGAMDLGCVDAWTVLRQGPQSLHRFYDPSGEVLEIPDRDDQPNSLLVDRNSLVVRHAEKERFEAAQGITNAAGHAPEGSRLTGTKSRGAPPKYNWEDFWCYMLLYIHCPGPPSTQTELLHVSREWFADRLGPDAVPCDSSIKSRLNKFWPDVKPNVGRPSAATAIR